MGGSYRGYATATVDDEDWDSISQLSWHIVRKGGGNLYAQNSYSWGRARGVYMHRMICRPPPRLEVHHLNENTLYNTRSNLISVTTLQHRALHRSRHVVSLSTGQFLAVIGKQFLELFPTREAAEVALLEAWALHVASVLS